MNVSQQNIRSFTTVTAHILHGCSNCARRILNLKVSVELSSIYKGTQVADPTNQILSLDQLGVNEQSAPKSTQQSEVSSHLSVGAINPKQVTCYFGHLSAAAMIP